MVAEVVWLVVSTSLVDTTHGLSQSFRLLPNIRSVFSPINHQELPSTTGQVCLPDISLFQTNSRDYYLFSGKLVVEEAHCSVTSRIKGCVRSQLGCNLKDSESCGQKKCTMDIKYFEPWAKAT